MVNNKLDITLSLKFSYEIKKEGKWFVSICPEFDVSSMGNSEREALENLKEAVGLYLETYIDLNNRRSGF